MIPRTPPVVTLHLRLREHERAFLDQQCEEFEVSVETYVHWVAADALAEAAHADGFLPQPQLQPRVRRRAPQPTAPRRLRVLPPHPGSTA
jgi:hypothetical protein